VTSPSPDPIVTPDDLAALLGTDVDPGRAETLIRLAQGLCLTVIDPVPASAAGVVLGIALRAYANPQSLESEGVAPYAATYGHAAGGLYLSKTDRATLRRLVARGGAFTIDPTPPCAGQNLPWWDRNTWPGGIQVSEDQSWQSTP
jgi:hypothetical protein